MHGSNVLVLASGRNVPSTRYRILPFVNRLRKLGYRCHVAMSIPEKYGSFACIGWRASQGLKRAVRRWQACRARHRQFDAIVLERELFDDPSWDLEASFRAATQRFILDIDDAIFLRYPEKFARIAGMADVVLAGNQSLAGVARKHCSDVRILPTAIPLEEYPFRPRHTQHAPAVVGWIGTQSNVPYLGEIIAALDEVQRSVPIVLRIVTGEPGSVQKLPDCSFPVEVRRWNARTALSEIAEFDIGVMPLPDVDWTRYKCGFKLLQYMASGIPAVGSRVGVNPFILGDGEYGLLAASTSEWRDALLRLLTDVPFAYELREKARRRVEETFSVAACIPTLVDALSRSK
ncbi:MAG: glycosyltransferase family 4 protein [Maioricimonas sp. JB049]